MPKRVSRLRLETSDGQPAFATVTRLGCGWNWPIAKASRLLWASAYSKATAAFVLFQPPERLAEPTSTARKRSQRLEDGLRNFSSKLHAPPTDASAIVDAGLAWTMGAPTSGCFPPRLATLWDPSVSP